jgi:hypothetical protein
VAGLRELLPVLLDSYPDAQEAPRVHRFHADAVFIIDAGEWELICEAELANLPIYRREPTPTLLWGWLTTQTETWGHKAHGW